MIEEQAVITKQQDGFVTLEIERASACALCGQKRGCGNATWGKLLGHDQHSVAVKNTLDAKVGDLVMVGLEEKVVLNAAMFLYAIPLAGLFIGALIMHWTLTTDLSVMIGAGIGLAVGLAVTKQFYQGKQKTQQVNHYARLLRFAALEDSQ